jgi:hypothetical protein
MPGLSVFFARIMSFPGLKHRAMSKALPLRGCYEDKRHFYDKKTQQNMFFILSAYP